MQWDVEIGRTYYYSLLTGDREVRPLDELILEPKGNETEVYLAEGYYFLGRVVDESLNERIKDFHNERKIFFTNVVKFFSDENSIQFRVMFPAASMDSGGTFTLFVPQSIVTRLQQIIERKNVDVSVLQFLKDSVMFQGKYICISRRMGRQPSLLTPRYRFELQSDSGRCTTITKLFNLDRSEYFKDCFLVKCDIQFAFSQSEIGEQSLGLGDLLQPVAVTSEYFKLWNFYEDEEKKSLKEMADKLQPLEYVRVKELNKDWLFEMESRIPPEWFDVMEEYGQVPVAVIPIEAKADDEEMPVGNINRISGNILKTPAQKGVYLPREGKLCLSLRGDVSIHVRREKAMERLLQRAAEIHNLDQILSLVNSGKEVTSDIPTFSRTTPCLLGGYTPQGNQGEAIDKALNTPDVCLIMGPPGTGKTSVIRTLIKRIKEERPNSRILITAYQHSAVDNAIAGLYQERVMSYRLDASREDNPEAYEDVMIWSKTVIEDCVRRLVERGEDIQLKKYEELEMALEDLDLNGEVLDKQRRQELTELLDKWESILPLDIKAPLERFLEENPEDNEEIAGVEREPDAGKIVEDLRRLLAVLPENFEDMLKAGLRYLENIRDAVLKTGKLNSTSRLEIEEVKRKFNELRRLLPSVKYSNTKVKRDEFVLKCKSFFDIAKKAEKKAAELDNETAAIPNTNDFLFRWKTKVVNHIDEQKKNGSSARSMILNQWVERLRQNFGVDKMFRRYAGVLGATCLQAGAKKFKLDDSPFDYVIVDEAARCNPLDLLVPMVMGRRVILVGDHRQLPHIIEHQLKKRLEQKLARPEMIQAFEDSIFARLWEFLPKGKKSYLDTQCRMNPVLGEMISKLFYQEPIKSGPGTDRLVNNTGFYEGKSLVWVNIVSGPGGDHYSNEREAETIVDHLVKLYHANTGYSIGVISFYRRQVDLIRKKLAEKGMAGVNIKVDTVDAFQGRQRDIILLSTVCKRGNKLGFTSIPNRQNVALSRARRLLVVFGDAEHLCKENEIFDQLYQICRGVENETTAV